MSRVTFACTCCVLAGRSKRARQEQAPYAGNREMRRPTVGGAWGTPRASGQTPTWIWRQHRERVALAVRIAVKYVRANLSASGDGGAVGGCELVGVPGCRMNENIQVVGVVLDLHENCVVIAHQAQAEAAACNRQFVDDEALENALRLGHAAVLLEPGGDERVLERPDRAVMYPDPE